MFMRHFWTRHEDISSEDSNLHEKDSENLNLSMSNTYQYQHLDQSPSNIALDRFSYENLCIAA